jgi:hypothetical protein
MHAHHPRLYSPANFLLGCRLALTARTTITAAQAIQELAPTPGRAFGKMATVLFALLAGVALLLAVMRGVGHSAPAVVQQMAPAVSSRDLAQGVALLIFAVVTWLLVRVGSSWVQFYASMCRLGQAHRHEATTRSPTLRCYTSED